MKKQAAS